MVNILPFGFSGTTEMITEAKIFWWPEMRKDIQQKAKEGTACLATGKNFEYQISKKLLLKT